ncbi:MAG: hypothetical protein P4N60_00590 [Verrucomicrobiae bacterium]|nr:hypothetical protein [Verrucomicrobiae bacterium]
MRKLLIALALVAAISPARAQVFTNLHSFTTGGGPNYTNFDGAIPNAGLVLSGNTLFGAAESGGASNCGTIFRLNTDGSGFTNLYSFTNGTDGKNPYATLLLSGNTLYGTTYNGGTSTNGTIFRINTNGTGFTSLYSFTRMINTTNSDGANPYAALIVTNGILYGTTVYGGRYGSGTVYAIGTNGLNFTNLHSFEALINYTNSEGGHPYGALVLAGSNVLYGTAYGGGIGCGTFFRIGVTGGATFTNLHTFVSGYDGNGPFGGLILVSNTIYGTTYSGGYGNRGLVYSTDTNATTINPVYYFSGYDGSYPECTLALAGNKFYGTTSAGGPADNGTVFVVNTDGTGFESLHAFSAHDPVSFTNRDGFLPYSGVVIASNVVYGTTWAGGYHDEGVVYGILVEPILTIARLGTNVVLTWPASFPGYNLEATTNLAPPINWSGVAGQYFVTNTIFPAKQKFYRLSNP